MLDVDSLLTQRRGGAEKRRGVLMILGGGFGRGRRGVFLTQRRNDAKAQWVFDESGRRVWTRGALI